MSRIVQRGSEETVKLKNPAGNRRFCPCRLLCAPPPAACMRGILYLIQKRGDLVARGPSLSEHPRSNEDFMENTYICTGLREEAHARCSISCDPLSHLENIVSCFLFQGYVDLCGWDESAQLGIARHVSNQSAFRYTRQGSDNTGKSLMHAIDKNNNYG